VSGSLAKRPPAADKAIREKTALIAMSGGVDSSVAAYLTQSSGYDCAGAMMRLYDNDDAGLRYGSTCCSALDAEDARAVANKLKMPFYVFNFSDDFRRDVIGKFISAYKQGETPNPCIDCNRFLKFRRFLRRADELERDCIVTGHYAKIGRQGDRLVLKKAEDLTKDQSYVLYCLTREQLSRTLFPLGTLPKTRVREIAEELGFVNAKKAESQDICFVPDGDYAAFIERYSGEVFPGGAFVGTDGAVLGRHRGIIRYTVGQRRGLGVSAAKPLYVRELRTDNNTVVLCENGELYSSRLVLRDINLIAADVLPASVRASVKIRYRHKEQPAEVIQTGADTLEINFDAPQRAVTKGQAAVIYDGDTVIGGGTISEVMTGK